MIKLDKSKLKDYEKFGFVVIKNLIPKKKLAEIIQSVLINTKKYAKLSNLKTNQNLDDLLLNLRKKNKSNFGLLFDSMQTLGKIYQVFMDDKTLEYVSKVLKVKKNLITFTDPALRLDPPNDYRNSLGWHQDSSYCRQNIDGNKGSVLWLPLRNLSKNMGRLQFIKSSHRIGTLNRKKIRNKQFSSQQRLIPENLIPKKSEIMEVDLKLGDALFMSLNLVHRSGHNISKKFRLSIIGRYHNMISNDFKSGLTIYRYSDKKYNKKAHESS